MHLKDLHLMEEPIGSGLSDRQGRKGRKHTRRNNTLVLIFFIDGMFTIKII